MDLGLHNITYDLIGCVNVQDRRHRRRNRGGSGEMESQKEYSDTDRSEIQDWREERRG